MYPSLILLITTSSLREQPSITIHISGTGFTSFNLSLHNSHRCFHFHTSAHLIMLCQSVRLIEIYSSGHLMLPLLQHLLIHFLLCQSYAYGFPCYLQVVNSMNNYPNNGIVAMHILYIIIIIIIIYHDFLPTPRRGSHVKSGKTHTQSSRYTP